MMQYRAPSKLEANKLLYMWRSIMSLVGFVYNIFYNNISSKIEIEKESSCLWDFKSKFNSNIQFKDKVMENKSLKLLGFDSGEAKKHAK